MRFLVDESAGQSVADELQRLGHDVISIQESYPGLDDPPILSMAVDEARITITNDKDFGELVYRSGLSHSGIVLFRLQDESASNRVRMIREALRVCGDRLEGNFTVVSEGKIRLRKT